MRTLLLVSLLLISACDGGADLDDPEVQTREDREEDAIALLERARIATRDVRVVAYDFEFAFKDAAVGWATGRTLMQHQTDLADSPIRVEGTVQLGPGSPLQGFAYSTDGEHSWSRLDAERRIQTARATAGGRSLGSLGVYGYLPEFVESTPFWKEIGSAQSLRLLGREEVGGVACDVVEVVWMEEETRLGPTRYLWYLGEEDHLPRGMHWKNSSTGPNGYEFLLSNLEVDVSLTEDSFRVEVPAGWTLVEQASTVALGDVSPDWELTSGGGEPVRLASLRGRVVVLDFWNTWCFICRNLQPSMTKIHRDYSEQPVTVLGLNVFEVSDPAPYWRDRRPGYDYLLDADSVAQIYDVPWQPAVVVIGPRGRVLLSLLGGTGDREQRVRDAIDEGLELLDPEARVSPT